MRLRFFDGRAASVSTGGIDNDDTLSGGFGQPAAVELPFLSLAPEILRLRVKKDHAGEVTSFFW
jgi:hypothetical protein